MKREEMKVEQLTFKKPIPIWTGGINVVYTEILRSKEYKFTTISNGVWIMIEMEGKKTIIPMNNILSIKLEDDNDKNIQ